jgi:ferritin-like metal-binding protein YciE
MQSFGRFGFPPKAHYETKPRIKSHLEKAQDRIEELNQVLEGHEARIEYLEACVQALCDATGVHVPEPSGL